MATKGELLSSEEAGWNEFLGMVESLTADQMVEPGYHPDGWSVKDLVGHIGGWQAETVQVLEQIRMGTYTSGRVDVDAFNELFFEANKDLPLSVVRAECWSARNRMLEEWSLLPEVTPEAEEWFLESGPNHYAEHNGRLREWVDELSAG